MDGEQFDLNEDFQLACNGEGGGDGKREDGRGRGRGRERMLDLMNGLILHSDGAREFGHPRDARGQASVLCEQT